MSDPCGGTGVVRQKAVGPDGTPLGRGQDGRWVRCDCGRMPDSRGAAKLAQQKRLDERLAEIEKRGWWG